VIDLIKRENEIFEILQKFLDEKLDFIVVGGYAVSAYKHRFSVDADIIIKEEDLKKFEKIMIKNKFKRTILKQIESLYPSKFLRFEKDKTSVDVLIDALISRQTDASFSFDLVMDNSELKTISGTEKEIFARVPVKELIIAMKLHSGRLTDFRDVAALAKNSDINKISEFLTRGNLHIVNDNINNFSGTLKKKGFADSFKGVFVEKKFDVDLNKAEEIGKIKLKEAR